MDLKIITLNCWGIPLLSNHRKQRIHAIAEMLASGTYDVVCLQEVWTDKDFELIRDKAHGSLPHAHYFHSGVVGSGVCILCRFPIRDAFFHQWPVNGYMHKLHHGDWFGGKGVGLCTFSTQQFTIHVYSAHLHAEYNRDCDEYQAHRVLQAFDTAQFIQLTSSNADVTILAGDLNTEPGDLAYKLLLNLPDFVDAFAQYNSVIKESSTVTEPTRNPNWATNDSPINSYTPKRLIRDGNAGKRIDYIMYRTGACIDVQLKSYKMPLSERVPNCQFSYSDHEAVTAEFHIQRSEMPCKSESVTIDEKKLLLEEAINICDEALTRLRRHRIYYLLYSLSFFVLLIVCISASNLANTQSPLFINTNILFHVIKIVISFSMIFTLIMAFVWNRIERHAILAAKLSMKLSHSAMIAKIQQHRKLSDSK